MGVTHVMRGEEWLTNVNKHVYLYGVLGAKVPKFVHLPLIKSMSGKKLAKRDGESSIDGLRSKRYEVDAVRSFLFGLGLNRGESATQQQGIQNKAKNDDKKQQSLRLWSLPQMINNFSLNSIGRHPVKYDKRQLDHLNRLSLKKRWKQAQTNPQQLQYFISMVRQLIPSSSNYDQQYCVRMVSAVVQRLNIVSDISLYSYYFQQINYYLGDSAKDFKKIYGSGASLQPNKDQSGFIIQGGDQQLLVRNRKILHNLRIIIQHVIPPQNYTEIQIIKHISQLLYQSPQLKNEDVYHLLRFIVTGRKSGPNISQACVIIGRDQVIKRLELFEGL